MAANETITDRPPFAPTHEIARVGVDNVKVMLTPGGAAYTENEWTHAAAAHHELRDNKLWLFEGQPFNGRVVRLQSPTPIADAVAGIVAKNETPAESNARMAAAPVSPLAGLNPEALKAPRDSVQITITIPKDIAAQVEVIAKDEVRTRAAMCAILIREGLALRTAPPPETKAPKGKKGKK